MKSEIPRFFKKNLGFVIVFLVSLIPLIDFLHTGLPLTHDGQDHVARIANFYRSLSEGNIIPRWAANLNWGYGTPILMFLYPFPSYFASFFHALGFSYVNSVKMVFGTAYILSGMAMYIWVREFLGEEAGILSAALYLFAPYRFVDLYVRGALGEHVAFIFPPLIFYFLVKISQKYSVWYFFGGVISFMFLLLSHNAIVIMFLPIIVLYSAYLAFIQKKKYLLYQYFLLLIIGFGVSSFFIVPAFFEGKYTLRDIVTSGEFANRFVNPVSFLYGIWSYGITGQLSTQIGLVQIALVALSLFGIRKIKKERYLYIGLLLCFFFSLFLMTQFSYPIWKIVTVLQKFQFPFRFLSVTIFLTAVLSAFSLVFVPYKYRYYYLALILVGLLIVNTNYWHAKSYLQKPESFYTQIYNSTTDTGESSPIWSVRFMEKRAAEQVEVIEGHASIQSKERNSTHRIYNIFAHNRSRIRENTLYFPGWKVYVDGKEVEVQYQDPKNRGLITYYVSEGKHVIEIIFQETKLRQFANAFSILSILILIAYPMYGQKLNG